MRSEGKWPSLVIRREEEVGFRFLKRNCRPRFLTGQGGHRSPPPDPRARHRSHGREGRLREGAGKVINDIPICFQDLPRSEPPPCLPPGQAKPCEAPSPIPSTAPSSTPHSSSPLPGQWSQPIPQMGNAPLLLPGESSCWPTQPRAALCALLPPRRHPRAEASIKRPGSL
jgi:hypothetical protein